MPTIHVKRQKVGAIVWVSRTAPASSVVGKPAWVRPGEACFGYSYQQLVEAADSRGSIELDAATMLHVKRQDAGVIVWTSRLAPNSVVVGEPAWVLPGEDYYGIPYQRLIAATDKTGTVELELPDDEFPVFRMVRRGGASLTDSPQ